MRYELTDRECAAMGSAVCGLQITHVSIASFAYDPCWRKKPSSAGDVDAARVFF